MTLKEFLLFELEVDVAAAHQRCMTAAYVSATVEDGAWYDPLAAQNLEAVKEQVRATRWLITYRLREYGVTRAQRIQVMKILAQKYRNNPGWQKEWEL